MSTAQVAIMWVFVALLPGLIALGLWIEHRTAIDSGLRKPRRRPEPGYVGKHWKDAA